MNDKAITWAILIIACLAFWYLIGLAILTVAT